ncbi:FAD binding domain-containing protein [Dactylonectria estremocensis]|uniref:FAD binding domain-containing protein n=1 Tax=Dactylonectria estremocensis TaxID=1079267 RepID=A0A9P9D0U2_9HYPO|nr:FAD binding domain-containing protein [Dactylonectria estremocensis]
MSASEGKFRVVVGGGPVGLCLAHSLALAGIDYVLLEGRDTVVEESGLGLALWPHGVRILDQIGLLEEARESYLPVYDKYNHRPDGAEIDHNELYRDIERNHGHPWMLFRRQKLLELLYTRLPEQDSRILVGKKVVSIDTHEYGVTVHCSDGTAEEGSIVVGCDGVHSTVRGIMRDLMLKSSVKVTDSESPMVAQYQMLALHLDPLPDMEVGRLWETRFDKMNIQTFMLKEQGWILAYKRLPTPITKRTRYTDEDAVSFATSFMDCPVTETKKFGDLWSVRRWFRLLNLEEGYVQSWHWDRIVLLGDSVHKMTPNAGLGLNQGWQGVAALTNILRRLLADKFTPNTRALDKAFAEYKTKTEWLAKNSMRLSSLYTRITAWHNGLYKAVDHLGPYLGGDLLIFKLLASPIVKRGIVLDFVPERGLRTGKIDWVNKAPEEDID